MPRLNASPVPRRIELCAGRERKEKASVTQSGTRFPSGRPTETVSQNIGSEWDAFSEWVVGGKFIPESALRLGRSFRMTPQVETTSRNLSSEWDSFSGWRAQRKLRPGICSETGTRFPADRPVLLNSKTCALSSAKLGRRKPKRNGRRSS